MKRRYGQSVKPTDALMGVTWVSTAYGALVHVRGDKRPSARHGGRIVVHTMCGRPVYERIDAPWCYVGRNALACTVCLNRYPASDAADQRSERAVRGGA